MGIIARQSIKASIVGLVGVAIGAFTRLFLYTKFLTVSEIGILETVVKLGVLMTPFFVVGAPQVILRFFNRFKEKQLNNRLIFTYAVLIFLIVTPIASLVYLLGKDLIFSLYAEAPELANYYLLPLLVAITYGGFSFLRSIAVVHLRITIPTFLSGVLDRLMIMVLLIAYGVYGLVTIDQFIYLNIIVFFGFPMLFMLIYLALVIKPEVVKPKFDEAWNIIKESSAYNTYLIFGTLTGVVISAIDVNMISGKLGTSLAGVYTIAFFMGTVIEIPQRSLTKIIYPILNKAILNNDVVEVKKLYQKSSVNQFLVGAFMFLVVWVNIDSIFAIIPNGDSFLAGKLVVLYIGLGKLFDMTLGVNRQIIELSKYYKFNLLISVILSILVIILNLIFIPLNSELFGGINGVAFASLLAVAVTNIFSLAVVWLKEGFLPFSSQMILVLIPIFMFYGLSAFISISNPLLSIAVKGVLAVLVFVGASYYFRISEDFMLILQRVVKRFKA